MKFAVLEYTSKSGRVWRHQENKPNYLCNPQTEIDPTSFGCYVSALKGEHVPLLGLIVGPVNHVSPAAVLFRKIIKRLSGSWPDDYNLEYLRRFDTIMTVHQLSDTREMIKAVNHLRETSPRPFIIGVPTQPYGILRQAVENNPISKKDLVDFIQSCDIFISVVRDTVDWYTKISGVKASYLPQPYPTHYATKFFKDGGHKNNTIIIAGVTQRSDITKGQLVAAAIQKKYPDLRILIPKVPELDYDTTNLGQSKYEFLPFEQWSKHLQTIARARLVINTDATFTRGRVQTDCAAVGTPSIGANSDGQRDLYPDLYSPDPADVTDLIGQAIRLLTDSDYYQQTVQIALDNLIKYDYQPSAERLMALVDQSLTQKIKSGMLWE
ncbi:MAG: hypothetical protein Q8P73_01440 [bacterium]|nr:hypothetical protein [bacterium]MDZ4342240.1 hypothetical protein [Candidatus Binatia bacterium]